MSKFSFDREAMMTRAREGAKRGVFKAATLLRASITEKLNRKSSNKTNGGNPSAPGEPPARQSGNLAKSFQMVESAPGPNHYRCTLGTNVTYARIQEFGGRIVPIKAKYLAIPIGVDGKWAARDSGGNLRNLQLRVQVTTHGLYLVKDLNKGQKAAKGSKAAKGAQTVFLFKLVKQVVLPARPYLRPSWAESKQAMNDTIQRSIYNAVMRRSA